MRRAAPTCSATGALSASRDATPAPKRATCSSVKLAVMVPRVGSALIAMGVVCALDGCSLLVDTSGLSRTASSADAAPDAARDAVASDGAGDAGADAAG